MIVKKIDNLSLETKYSFLAEFFNDLDKFNKLRTQKEKKMCMIHFQNYITTC